MAHTLDGLTKDIILYILGFLPVIDILRFRMTCKRLRDCTKEKSLWANIIQNYWHIWHQFHPRSDMPRTIDDLQSASRADLEALAIRETRLETQWSSPSPRPISVKEVPFECDTHELILLPGGRWLLNSDGPTLSLWDLEVEKPHVVLRLRSELDDSVEYSINWTLDRDPSCLLLAQNTHCEDSNFGWTQHDIWRVRLDSPNDAHLIRSIRGPNRRNLFTPAYSFTMSSDYAAVITTHHTQGNIVYGFGLQLNESEEFHDYEIHVPNFPSDFLKVILNRLGHLIVIRECSCEIYPLSPSTDPSKPTILYEPTWTAKFQDSVIGGEIDFAFSHMEWETETLGRVQLPVLASVPTPAGYDAHLLMIEQMRTTPPKFSLRFLTPTPEQLVESRHCGGLRLVAWPSDHQNMTDVGLYVVPLDSFNEQEPAVDIRQRKILRSSSVTLGEYDLIKNFRGDGASGRLCAFGTKETGLGKVTTLSVIDFAPPSPFAYPLRRKDGT